MFKLFVLALLVAPVLVEASASSAYGKNSCTYSPPTSPDKRSQSPQQSIQDKIDAAAEKFRK